MSRSARGTAATAAPAPTYMTYEDTDSFWYAARHDGGGYSERVKCENEQVAKAQVRAWRKAARTGAVR